MQILNAMVSDFEIGFAENIIPFLQGVLIPKGWIVAATTLLMYSINFYFQNFIDEHEKNNQLDAAAITA